MSVPEDIAIFRYKYSNAVLSTAVTKWLVIPAYILQRKSINQKLKKIRLMILEVEKCFINSG